MCLGKQKGLGEIFAIGFGFANGISVGSLW